jgi:hypothetical protein
MNPSERSSLFFLLESLDKQPGKCRELLSLASKENASVPYRTALSSLSAAGQDADELLSVSAQLRERLR